MNQPDTMKDLNESAAKAVAGYWKTRAAQQPKQESGSRADQGLRSAVTAEAQMNGFIDLFSETIARAGIPERFIFRGKAAELPGFFRPTIQWELIVVRDHRLIAAIKAESQIVTSFGGNMNSHTEETLGHSIDFWAAYRQEAYLRVPQPFLGYFFMLEDCEASSRPVGVQEPHYRILPEYDGASYMKRYELFCRKIVLERLYSAAAFIASTGTGGLAGEFRTPAEDLSVERFIKALSCHTAAWD